MPVNIVIHDKRIPRAYIEALEKKLPEAVFMPFSHDAPQVYGSIAHHPDIYFFQADKDMLVHSPDVDKTFLERLTDFGIKLVRGYRSPYGKYPSTALYNAARVGKNIFLNIESVDRAVLETARGKGLTLVDVTQGYTRCSVLSVGEKAIITSDRKIAAEALDKGLDVFEVSPYPVLLPGETHGFIGGAGGSSPGGEVILLGDAGLHPQGAEIKDFISVNSAGCVLAETLPLYDAGSLVICGV